MSTNREKVEAQARIYMQERHAVGPAELEALLNAASRPAPAQAGEDIGSLVGFQRVSASDGAPAQAAEGVREALDQVRIEAVARYVGTYEVTMPEDARAGAECFVKARTWSAFGIEASDLAALSTPPPDARLREAADRVVKAWAGWLNFEKTRDGAKRHRELYDSVDALEAALQSAPAPSEEGKR